MIHASCKVVSGGNMAEADRALMRKQCEAAMQAGGYFTIDTVWELHNWYTIYNIYLPEAVNKKEQEKAAVGSPPKAG